MSEMSQPILSRKEQQQRGALRQRQLRSRATKHEMLVKDALDALGIRYRFQKVKLCGGTSIVVADFWISKPYRCFLEIDGASHTADYNAQWEARLQRSFGRQKRVLRLTNAQIEEWHNRGTLQKALLSALPRKDG